MTEQGARTKWCPMWRFVQFGNNAEWQGRVLTNRNIFLEEDTDKCIASDCMMWRWERDRYAEGYELKPDHEDYNKGYCGLGGKP